MSTALGVIVLTVFLAAVQGGTIFGSLPFNPLSGGGVGGLGSGGLGSLGSGGLGGLGSGGLGNLASGDLGSGVLGGKGLGGGVLGSEGLGKQLGGGVLGSEGLGKQLGGGVLGGLPTDSLKLPTNLGSNGLVPGGEQMTCGLLNPELPMGVFKDSACNVYCRAQGNFSRGGVCKNGLCVCQEDKEGKETNETV